MTNAQPFQGMIPDPDGMWQYAVHKVDMGKLESYARDMNELGVQGWELVSASPLSLSRAGGGSILHGEGNHNFMVMIYKRRLRKPG